MTYSCYSWSMLLQNILFEKKNVFDITITIQCIIDSLNHEIHVVTNAVYKFEHGIFKLCYEIIIICIY